MRYLTDETGAVVHTYDYDAFGNVLNETDTPAAKDSSGHFVTVAANEFMFAGEQFDADLGLYYNRARYLDVRMGRFWGMDTDEGSSDDPTSLHSYLYVGGSPVDWSDPSGHGILPTVLESILVGKEVHELLYAEFKSEFPLGVANQSIATILNLGIAIRRDLKRNGIGIYLRPDLVDAASTTSGTVGQVYEIKPRAAVYLGIIQVLNYIRVLSENDPVRNRVWTTGYSYVPRRLLYLEDGRRVWVDPPRFGVIGYELDDTSSFRLNPGLISSVALMITLAMTATLMGISAANSSRSGGAI